MERDVWFLSIHMFAKVTFFRGTSLVPCRPSGRSRTGSDCLHIHEKDDFGKQLRDWVLQAMRLPEEKL